MEESQRKITALRRTLRAANPSRTAPARHSLAKELATLARLQQRAGAHRAAVASATEAFQLLRALLADPAEAARHTSQRWLFASVASVVANDLRALAQVPEALVICREALAVVQAGDASSPDILEGIAGCNTSVGMLQIIAGQREAGVATLVQATAPLQTLARLDPGLHAVRLAEHLLTLMGQYSVLGTAQACLEAATEALRICRANVQARPADFEPLLARSLCATGVLRKDRGEWDRALGLLKESVELSRRIWKARPDFTEHYVKALNSLAGLEGELGMWQESVDAGIEAVALYRTLVREDPWFTSDLATSLQNLASRLLRMDRDHEAGAPAAEAVELYRKVLGSGDDEVFFRNQSFARSLLALASYHRSLRHHKEAVANIREAIAVLRKLGDKLPELATADLATVLIEASSIEREAGNLDVALKVALEGTNILKSHRKGSMSQAQLPQYSTGLVVLARAQTAVGSYADALATSQLAFVTSMDFLERLGDKSIGYVTAAACVAWEPACALGDEMSLAALCDPLDAVMLRGTLTGRKHAFIKVYSALLQLLSDHLHELPQTAAAMPVVELTVENLRGTIGVAPETQRPRLAAALAVQGLRQRAAGEERKAAASFAESVQYLMLKKKNNTQPAQRQR